VIVGFKKMLGLGWGMAEEEFAPLFSILARMETVSKAGANVVLISNTLIEIGGETWRRFVWEKYEKRRETLVKLLNGAKNFQNCCFYGQSRAKCQGHQRSI